MIFFKLVLKKNRNLFQGTVFLKQTWCYWINYFLKCKSWMHISDCRHWLATALSTWRWLTGRRNTDWQILLGDANIFFKKNDAGQFDKYFDIKVYFWHILHDEYWNPFQWPTHMRSRFFPPKTLEMLNVWKWSVILLKRLMAKMEFNFAFFNRFHIVIQCKISFQWVSMVQCNIEDHD